MDSYMDGFFVVTATFNSGAADTSGNNTLPGFYPSVIKWTTQALKAHSNFMTVNSIL